MIEFKITNVEQVIAALRANAAVVVSKLYKSLAEGIEYFSGDFIKKQLSGNKEGYGRTSKGEEGGFGLYVRTGTLRNSWTVRGQGVGIDAYSVKLATWVKYAAIHQYSGFAGKNHRAFIPKRLYLIESFEEKGFEFIQKAVDKNLSKLIKIG